MAITTLLSEARDRRAARRAERHEHQALVTELSAYSTPAERLELELLAVRSDSPDAEIVLDILDRLPIVQNQHRKSA